MAAKLDMMSRNVGSTDVSSYPMTQYLKETNNLPTALFRANDQIAIGAMAALVDAGIRIPKDVAIVGFMISRLPQLCVRRLPPCRRCTCKSANGGADSGRTYHQSLSFACSSDAQFDNSSIMRMQKTILKITRAVTARVTGLGDHDHIRHEVKRKQAVARIDDSGPLFRKEIGMQAQCYPKGKALNRSGWLGIVRV